MPEKLLTIKEVAEYLKLPEEEVKRLVDIGEIPAYKIGGSFLRFRKDQLDAIRTEITEIEENAPQGPAKADSLPHAEPAESYAKLEEDVKRYEPKAWSYDYTFAEKIRDFFYFYDFYIVSIIFMAVLVYLIAIS